MTISDSFKDSLLKSQVIPQVIHNESFSPRGFLMINYGSEKEVTLGNKLKPSETQSRPNINFTLNVPTSTTEEPLKITNDDRFTLIMTDPDAPTRGDEKWSEYCHYLSTDIKLNTFDSETFTAVNGNDIAQQLTTQNIKGDDLVPYMGPGPPKNTGLHRYVFLLYRQKSDGSKMQKISDRPCWGSGIPGYGAHEYAQKNHLELLAANFFYAEAE